MELEFCRRSLIHGENDSSALQLACSQKLEGNLRAADEQWRPFSSYQREDHEVQLIHQAMDQQVVPERSPTKNQHVLPILLFEFGNLFSRVCYLDDSRVVPRSQLFFPNLVRDD